MSPLISFPFLKRQSDARLVALARAGNDRAFEALVERYRPALLAYARRLVGADSHAEDALQQALLQAWVALRADAEPLEVKPWLFRIVHNAAITAMRRRQLKCVELNEALDTAGVGDAEARLAAKETLAHVAALPELQRRAIVLTAFWGSSHEEAAATLGVTGGAVRGLVHRARTSLRRAAAAVLPTPVTAWLTERSTRRAQLPDLIGELAAGAGSAGAGGLLLKGGAIAVTAGVLAAAVHVGVPSPFPAGPHRGSARAVAGVAGASRSIRHANAHAGSASPVAAGPAGPMAANGVRIAGRSRSADVAHASARDDGGAHSATGASAFAPRHATGSSGQGPTRSGEEGGRNAGPRGGDGGGQQASSGSGDGHTETSGSDGAGGSGGATSSLSGSGSSPDGSGSSGSGPDGGGSGSGGRGTDGGSTSGASGGPMTIASDGSDGGSGSSDGGGTGDSTSNSTSSTTSGPMTTSTSGPTTTSTSGPTTTSASGSSGSDG